MSVLYQDDHVICDEDAVTVRWYYFPVGDKRIPYDAIRGVQERTMGALTGRWRIWGSGDLRHWFHLDTSRPQKQRAIVLDCGGWVKPVLTPADPDAVLEILRELTAAPS